MDVIGHVIWRRWALLECRLEERIELKDFLEILFGIVRGKHAWECGHVKICVHHPRAKKEKYQETEIPESHLAGTCEDFTDRYEGKRAVCLSAAIVFCEQRMWVQLFPQEQRMCLICDVKTPLETRDRLAAELSGILPETLPRPSEVPADANRNGSATAAGEKPV